MANTKTIETVYYHNENGIPESTVEVTEEHLCSVELGENAKGEVQVKGVKVYAATAGEAAIQAVAALRELRSYLADFETVH